MARRRGRWQRESVPGEAAPGAEPAPLAEAHGVRLLHLEAALAVVDKPAGLPTETHPKEPRPPGERPPSVTEVLPGLIRKAKQVEKAEQAAGRRPGKRPPPVYVVHRLDKGTSGLLVFARTREAARALAQQFRVHSVTRVYRAWVHGRLAGARRLESTLVADRGDGLRGSHPTRGQRAVTHVRPLQHAEGVTLVECRLETGRTHQIRIHLAEAGHPVIGETLYHRPRGGSAPRPDDAPRLLLHAAELGFTHPQSEAPLAFRSEAGETFAEAVAPVEEGQGPPRFRHAPD